MPLVAIILCLFALGFIALVIDLGNVYIKRKAMITSADAAALAGAQVLRVSKGVNVALAKTTAEEYAASNGADPHKVDVYVGLKSVTLPNEDEVEVTETRQVVEVTVGINEPSIFARFLGFDKTDVKAHAIATWGYVYKSYIGAFPLFVFDITAETDGKIKPGTDIFLHDKYGSSNNSYGLISMDSGKSTIKAVIAGESAGGTYIEGDLLNGEPGQVDAISNSVEARMILAHPKSSEAERRETMIVIVPVIDHDKFLAIDSNDSGNAAKYQLPIKYFAYFEIKDIISKNKTVGSPQALDPNNHYYQVSSAIDYAGSLFSAGEKAEYSFIYGQFTGVTVEANILPQPGDQTNPDNGGEAPATYSKLIK